MNPWETVKLSDYENHMSLESVKQLQALNEMMKVQLEKYPVESAMVLGIAGGNGLERIDRSKYRKVFAIDINDEYIDAVNKRYCDLGDILECKKIDVINEWELLPECQLVIADLFLEYVGYESFKNAVLKTDARFVSCIIQINAGEKTWVSDSPYIHAFDGLDAVHHQMDEDELTLAMQQIGFTACGRNEFNLPNGKKFIMLDYRK